MKAKDYLKQLKKLDKMIENKLAEKQHWKEIATGTTQTMSMDRVQTSGNQQKMADAISRYMDIEKEIDRRVDKLIDARREIVEVIEQLDATEYDMLHKLYVQYWTMQDVANAMDKSYSWVTTVHGRALQRVQTIIDQREKV